MSIDNIFSPSEMVIHKASDGLYSGGFLIDSIFSKMDTPIFHEFVNDNTNLAIPAGLLYFTNTLGLNHDCSNKGVVNDKKYNFLFNELLDKDSKNDKNRKKGKKSESLTSLRRLSGTKSKQSKQKKKKGNKSRRRK
tara:strand:+ start:373 stop:780 length:408 start_codon:yes stop_codon:yes gene_type:complete